jgi:hypothetical protein
VLFTDGEDNTSLLGERELRAAAKRSNATVHVVGLRDASASPTAPESAQVRALREIAQASGGRFWTAESPARLREAFAAIAASMGERYVLRYEPQGSQGQRHGAGPARVLGDEPLVRIVHAEELGQDPFSPDEEIARDPEVLGLFVGDGPDPMRAQL